MNLKKNWKRFLWLPLLVFCLGGGTVWADQTNASNSFSISPLNPDTNLPQSTYYNLTVKPNEEKEIKVRIFNSSSEALTVKVALNDATTNENGVISYSGEGEKDNSLKVAFTSMAHLDQEQVRIHAKGSYDASIKIKVPSEQFTGTVLGGVRVTSVTASNASTSAAIKANIAYSVAVLMTEDGAQPDPSMHLLGVKKESRNYRNYISAELQNSSPRLIKKLEVDAKVYKKNSSKLLYEAKKSEMQMAPNSKFAYGISLENTAFTPGKYRMVVTGTADGKAFSFSKDFEITSKEAKTYNKNSVYVTSEPTNALIFYLMGGIFVVLLLAFVYWLRKRTKGK